MSILEPPPSPVGQPARRSRAKAGWWSLFLIGVAIGAGGVFFYHLSAIRYPVSGFADSGRISVGGTAIANFGVLPVNPDWLQLTHGSTGQPLDTVPSHEWAVLASAYEPHVEKIPGPNEWDRPTWRITFE